MQQLFHYLTQTLSDYYCQKILDVISGKSQSITKYFPSKKKLTNMQIIQESDEIFVVKNIESKAEYEVNPALGFCTCPIGNSGAPCKHQHFVSIEKEKFCPNIIPIDPAEKIKFHFIAVGNADVDPNWYSPLLPKSDDAIKVNLNSDDNNSRNAICSMDDHNSDEDSEHAGYSININSKSERQIGQESNAKQVEIKWEDSEKKFKEMMMILKEKFEKKSD